MNYADKMEMGSQAHEEPGRLDGKPRNGNHRPEKSNAYTSVRIREIGWRGNTYQITEVDGMTCQIERQ